MMQLFKIRSPSLDEALPMQCSQLFPSIAEFKSLATQLDLSEEEELTLLQLAPAEWADWQSNNVPPASEAPQRLVRRLDYALSLLKRMRSASPARN